MKIFFALLALFTLTCASRAWADTPPAQNSGKWVDPNDSDNTDPPETGSWFMQMNGDLGSPTGNLANRVNQGWGGEASIGYHLPENFEISIELGYDSYSVKNSAQNASWNMMPLVLKGTYLIGDEFIQPYVFIAGGLAFNSQLANAETFGSSNNEADLLGEAGLGLAFNMTESS
ncbi:MAG TPA: hypothetical protein VK791_11875, partial [bacterium]|nr:hypothetical protein [bacterium]